MKTLGSSNINDITAVYYGINDITTVHYGSLRKLQLQRDSSIIIKTQINDN